MRAELDTVKTVSYAGRMAAESYHHGNLRAALLEAAVAQLAESGPESLSLRELARSAGVSHAAPAHHFDGKAGLLTAVAAEGHRRFAAALRTAWESTGDFLEVGVAYVVFAREHPGYFSVMFRPDLVRMDDPDLVAAVEQSNAVLYGPVAEVAAGDPDFDVLLGGLAAWSLVHGLASLLASGALPPEIGSDPAEVTRRVAGYLYRQVTG